MSRMLAVVMKNTLLRSKARNYSRALERDRDFVEKLAVRPKFLDELFSNRMDETLSVISTKDAGDETQLRLTHCSNKLH